MSKKAEAQRLWDLKILVIVAGAVLMGLEIVGSRLLAPHFGNSVFVWGSLISVFLGALSGGYYAGGLLADRRPSFVFLLGTCLTAALLILLAPWKGHELCRSLVDREFREQTGPLVASIILFLPASFCLGMVSPFSVRLAAADRETVGRVAGTLYALSTVGSIAGTLVTTFVLIPAFGVGWIFRGLGFTLAGVSAILLVTRRGTGPLVAAAAAVVAVGAFVEYGRSAEFDPATYTILLDEDTPYHHISVIDDRKEKIRLLKFDKYTESSISLEEPHESKSRYTNYFHLAFLARPDIARTLFIGAGGGVGPRSYSQMNPEMAIDVVDIDGRVLEIAEEHFHMPATGRVRPIVRDGRMFVQFAKETYDCIVVDAFTIGGRIPFHLVTREFFELCRNRLDDRGIFTMNVISGLEGDKGRIFRSITKTLADVFPHVYVFAVGYRVEEFSSARNVILVALAGDPPLSRDQWRAAVGRYPEKSYLKRAGLEAMVGDLVWPTPDVANGDLLTDDYAPIETMRFH